jgi:hypothetical protein
MTVRTMRETMDQAEYVYWSRYYARRAQEQQLELRKAGMG